jgi:hypothetical protein
MLSHGRRETALDNLTPLGVAASSSISAQDTAAKLKPAPSVKPEVYAICGARTNRGTPCQHRVPAGQRCAQHQGQPSMLLEDAGQGEGKPAKTP